MDDVLERAVEEIRHDVKTLLAEVNELKGAVSGMKLAVGLISAIISATVAGVLVAALSGCAAPSTWPPSTEDNDLDRSVAALVTETGRPFCAGVAVRQGILTAYHCIDHGGGPEGSVLVSHRGAFVYSEGRFSHGHEARVIWSDRHADLAMLEPIPTLEPRPVRLAPPSLGERIRIMGHPGGIVYELTRGYVSHTPRVHHRPEPFANPSFGLDAAVDPGNSGGPVFDVFGNVIGIVSWKMYTQMSEAAPVYFLH